MDLDLEKLKVILQDPEGTRPQYVKIKSKKFPLIDFLINVQEGTNLGKTLGLQIAIKTKNGLMLGYDLENDRFIEIQPTYFEPSPVQKILPLILIGFIGYLAKKAIK